MAARLLKDPATINSRIFVGHLQTEDMNKHELEEHFQKYGNVVGSSINRGFGFVQFEEEASALQAIQNENGTMFKGRRIDVRPAKKDNQNSGGGSGGGGMGGGGGGGNPGLGGVGVGSGGGGENQGNFPLGQGGGSNAFGGGSNQFTGANDSFGSGNQSFGSGNSNFGPGNNQNFANDQFGPGNLNRGSANDQFPGPNQISFSANQPRGIGNDQFVGNQAAIQPRNTTNDQFPGGNQNRGALNQNRGGSGDQFASDINRGPGDQFAPGNQNRGPGNQNRGPGNEQFSGGAGGNQNQGQNQNQNQIQNQCPNQNQNQGPNQNQNQGPNQNQNQGPNQNQNQNRGGGGNQFGGGNQNNQGATQAPGGRPRGNRGGKNRNKNRDNGGGGGGGGGNNNFRDRSPISRGIHIDEKAGRDWDRGKMGDRGRGIGYGRDFGDIGRRGYDDFAGLPGRDVSSGFGSLSGASDYQPSATAEKNDCEIIVVSKALTEYAEAIEMRLKKLGLTVDLLFPNEDVPLSRVLGNIASRGCLYAVVVTHMNQEHRSLTLNILHGLPQEHRNMPVEDAIGLINRDFTSYRAGSTRSVPINVPLSADRHPDAVQVLLNMLADNRQLTVLQYDRVLKYLEVKREEQVQIELGDAKDLAAATLASDPKQAELQSRILNILNSSKPAVTVGPVPSPVPAPTPVPPANWGAAPSATAPTTSAAPSSGVTPSPLLNDPTVQKALDSLLQGNLLKSIGDQQPATSTPLFAAFPNIGRF